jgi:hypothetical protein
MEPRNAVRKEPPLPLKNRHKNALVPTRQAQVPLA